MPSLTRKYKFKNDTEGWVFNTTGDAALIKGRQRPISPRNGSTYSERGYDFTLNGSLVSSVGATYEYGCDSSDNWWYLTTNWADMFPELQVGATVNSVTVFHTVRFFCSNKRNGVRSVPSRRNSSIQLSEGDAYSGPVEFYNFDNSEKIGDISTNQINVARRGVDGGDSYWSKYPYNGNTANPIVEIPSCWLTDTGTMEVPEGYRNITDTFTFRINNHLPATSNNDSPGGDIWYFLGIHMNNVWITIDYDLPLVWTNGTKNTTGYINIDKISSSFTNNNKNTTGYTNITRNLTSFTNADKVSTDFTNENKSTSLWTNDNKINTSFTQDNKNSTSFTNNTKIATSFTNSIKNNTEFTNENKNETIFTNEIKI